MKTIGLILLTAFIAAQAPAQATKLLWADIGDMSETGGKINMSNLDGSEYVTLVDSLFFPAGLAVDNSSSPPELYFAERGKDRILRIKIGDTTMQEAVTNIPGIYDLELDLNLRKVFWISNTYSRDAVSRADMDDLNSNVEDLYISTSTGYDYTGLAIDPSGERLFWVRRDNGCEDYIFRMNYDKTDFQYLIEYPENQLIGPWDIDLYENTIYWTDCGLAEDIIYKANTDGSDIDTVIQDVNTLFFVIDSSDSKIYWNDDDVIGRSNLDGTERDTLQSELGDFIYGMAIAYNVPDTTLEPPEPDGLNFLNASAILEIISVYPNPIEQSITVEYRLNTQHEISIQLIDIQGKILETFIDRENKSIGKHQMTFSLPDGLPSGNYLLTLCTAKEFISIKIIKQ